MNHLEEVRKCGQSIWLDYISRELITSGKLGKLVADGLRGLTSNPTIFQKAIAQGTDYDARIEAVLGAEPGIDIKSLYEKLAVADIQMAADILRPVWEESRGADGFVSLEVSPELAGETEGTIAEARRLWRLVDRPNLLIKVPATPQGIAAVESLIAGGINVNVTLMFSLVHYNAVAAAYIRGVARNPRPESVASVASFFVSRLDTYIDRELEQMGTEPALALRGKAAVANTRLVYRRYQEVFYGHDFEAVRRRGARVQRPLWGSTSTKNPAYPDVIYVDNLIGPDVINTMPMETIEAFQDHGRVSLSIREGVAEAERTLAALAGLGLDLAAITEQLQKDGVKAFADSFRQLLEALERKMVTSSRGASSRRE